MSFLYLAGVVTLVHIMAVASPGPDFFLAVRNSLMYNRRIGVYTAMGFALGNLVHISYCFLGIAVILSQHPEIARWVKLAGALYLMWLAYKSWMASGCFSNDDKQTAKQNGISSWAALRSGFFTNLLNVKCSLYFLGLFTTLIRPGTPIWQVAMLCLLMFIITVIWFTLVALIFTNVRIRKVYLLRQVWINRTLAVFLTVLAIKVLIG